MIEGQVVSGSRLGIKLRTDAHGVHLFDRATGLNVLVDDIDVPADQWAKAPRYVSIAITNACELKCSFCYAPKVSARLDAPTIGRWVRELDEAGCLGVGFGGGEPTAHPEFADLCKLVSERTSIAVTMTTHAHRFDKTLARALRGNVHFIRVSVDATGDAYERIRGRSFDTLRGRLRTVATVAPFGINMVVGEATLDQLNPVADFAAEAGAVELLLLPQQSVAQESGLSGAGLEELASWMNSYRGPVRLAISRLGTPEGLPLAEPFGREDPLDGHAHIDAFGRVRTDAYAAVGVPVDKSVLVAVEQLRRREAR